MDVGMMMVYASYGWENCSDGRVWDEEIRLARIADEQVDHHPCHQQLEHRVPPGIHEDAQQTAPSVARPVVGALLAQPAGARVAGDREIPRVAAEPVQLPGDRTAAALEAGGARGR